MFAALKKNLRNWRSRGAAVEQAKSKQPGMFEALKEASNADQYFVQPTAGAWLKTWGGVQLEPALSPGEQSRLSGCRLQPYDKTGNDPSREGQTQYDLAQTVAGLNRLREQPDYAAAVLGGASLVTRESGRGTRSWRILFTLQLPSGKKHSNSVSAARVCHRRIKAGIRRAGLRVESPKEFDSGTGMKGLEEWAGKVRLRPGFRLPWFLLLLPLLALLGPCLTTEPKPEPFPSITTEGYILLIDKSSSMQSAIDIARTHIQQLMQDVSRKWSRHKVQQMNVIAYDENSTAAFDGMKPVDPTNLQGLTDFTTRLQAQGGTKLSSAMAIAAAQITKSGIPTTIHIITDAEDNSIPEMLQNIDALKKTFGTVPVTMYATSPRAISSTPGVIQSPATAGEKQLDNLVRNFGGHFGTKVNTP